MFGIQNTNNSNQFKTVSTDTLEKPKNGKFYALFNRSRYAINALGYGGQVLSAITEFIAVYSLFERHLYGVIGGLFAVVLFEIVGLRIVLKTLVRSIVRKEYKSIYAKALIFLLLGVFVSLLFANVNFSLTGNTLVFHQKEDRTTHNKVFTIDSLMNIELSKIETEYQKKDSIEFVRVEAAKANTNKSYSSTLKNLNRSKWVEGANLLNINKSIETKENDKLSKIEKLDSDLSDFRERQEAEKQKRLLSIRTSFDAKKDGIKKASNSNNKVLAYIKNSIRFLLFAFIIISIISIVFEEIFFKGSDIDLNTKEQRLKPNLFIEFVRGLYNGLYHLGYIIVLKINSWANYDYTTFDSNKTTFDGTKWLQEKQNKKQLKKVGATAKSRQRIGFQGATASTVNPSAFQDITQDASAKNEVLKKYKIQTVISWFKRSDLVQNSLSKTDVGKAKNRQKYLEAKRELSKVGVQFVENKNSVTIKV